MHFLTIFGSTAAFFSIKNTFYVCNIVIFKRKISWFCPEGWYQSRHIPQNLISVFPYVFPYFLFFFPLIPRNLAFVTSPNIRSNNCVTVFPTCGKRNPMAPPFMSDTFWSKEIQLPTMWADEKAEVGSVREEKRREEKRREEKGREGKGREERRGRGEEKDERRKTKDERRKKKEERRKKKEERRKKKEEERKKEERRKKKAERRKKKEERRKKKEERRKKKGEEKESEERRKKMQVCEKKKVSRPHCFSTALWLRGVEKLGLLKRRARNHLGRWEMKNCTQLWCKADFEVKKLNAPERFWGLWCWKVHAGVARSTCRNAKCKKQTVSGNFWECAPLSREAHFQVKMYKHLSVGALWKLRMFKKCMPLWRGVVESV